jgi:kynureninase
MTTPVHPPEGSEPALDFSPDEACALRLDREDPLASCRERFLLPKRADGEPVVYLAGNSLGLQPKGARALVEREMDDWAALGVEAHFKPETPWYSYHELFRESGARLAGARPAEVVMMNSLTVNLHLMMETFYRPSQRRRKILVEQDPFPSDAYAVASQIRRHGFDPKDTLVVARARRGEDLIRTEEIETLLGDQGKEIALVVMSGVHYLTGQVFDMERIAAAARRQGCAVGFDLAHAAGNVPLRLHDWQVDFAVWCSYKYLNGGPGAVGGCFVHEEHGRNQRLPRLTGWWGNDPATRFQMRMEEEYVPRPGADGWQISNPPILAMAPLLASFAIFDQAGIGPARDKSLRLTAYLRYLLERLPGDRFEVITPAEAEARGCQVSIRARRGGGGGGSGRGGGTGRRGGGALDLVAALAAEGIVADFRDPDVIRAAPVPLYNTFLDVWRFARALDRAAGAPAGHAGGER